MYKVWLLIVAALVAIVLAVRARGYYNKSTEWSSFSGQPSEFPLYVTYSGLPLTYELKLRNGKVVKALWAKAENPKWRDFKSLDEIPNEEVTGWRPAFKL